MEQDWKEEIVNSIHGMQRAEPSPFLFSRIEARLAKKYNQAPVWQLSLATVAMIVLLVVNSVVLVKNQRSKYSAEVNPYRLSTIQSY
jgi:hypothetical protein